MSAIAELELARIEWGSFRQIVGDASGIRSALSQLLSASTTEEVRSAYWGLENWVVAQRTVYSSAEPTISVLMAAFADPRIRQIKVAALNLIYEVLRGWPDPEGTDPGNAELISRCKDRVREGMWLLVREALTGLGDAALDVIELVDEERAEQVRVWLAQGPALDATSG